MFTTRRLAGVLLCTALTTSALGACSSGDSASTPAGGSPTKAAAGTSAAATAPTSSGAPAAGGSPDAAACDITDPATVTGVFGGTSAPEKAGEARNCEYKITGGSAAIVEVYALGSSDAWDTFVAQAKDVGGPITTVALGDGAVATKLPANTLYVKDGGRILGFQVVDLTSARSHLADLEKLARAVIG